MNQLTLRYKFAPDDDLGWLDVAVTGHFAGRAGFWVQRQDVAAFGQALRAYPLAADAPVVGAWGYAPLEGEALAIRLAAAPANPTGDVRIDIEIADFEEPAKRLRTTFLTHYPQLEAFSNGIAKLMSGAADEAVLTGS